MYKLLIIDDEIWARRVIKKLLPWQDLSLELVGEAWDGEEGIEMIEKLQPHIVITDMKMPGLDGVDLLKTLSETFKEIKIIAMSGYNDFVYLKQAISSRAIDYLLKPVDGNELIEALKKAIASLEKEKTTSIEKLGLLRLLDDDEKMSYYLSEQRKMDEALMDFNHGRSEKIIRRLGLFFQGEEDRVFKLISHNIIKTLEHFIASNNYELKGVLPKEALLGLESSKTAKEIMTNLIEVLEQSIKKMVYLNQEKKHLSIDEVKVYMKLHYSEGISLESIASSFYVSKEHLSRTFKAQEDETIHNYLIKLRMEKSKELILKHNMSIKHVSKTVGYDDIAYFYRVFKKYYGLAPGLFKKSHQDNTSHPVNIVKRK
jgi:two-component system response regulator YesN